MAEGLQLELLRLNLLDDIELELSGRIRFKKHMDALGLVFAWWRKNHPELLASISDLEIQRIRERVIRDAEAEAASVLPLPAKDLLEAPLVPLNDSRALLADFPLAARDLDRGWSPFGQRGGVEFDAGWNGLAREAFAFLEREADARKRIGFPDSALPRIGQAKEKFGQLRLYADAVPTSLWEPWHQLKTVIEGRSATICERCSAPGSLRRNGWVHVYCDSCEDAYRAERGES